MSFRFVVKVTLFLLLIVGFLKFINYYYFPLNGGNVIPEKLESYKTMEYCNKDIESVRECPNGDYLVSESDNIRSFFDHDKNLLYRVRLDSENDKDRQNSIIFYTRNIFKVKSGCDYEESKNVCNSI